jgi:hypothetical protein
VTLYLASSVLRMLSQTETICDESIIQQHNVMLLLQAVHDGLVRLCEKVSICCCHIVYQSLLTLDSGLWTLDSGLWTLDSGLWTLDSGLWTLTLFTHHHRMLHHACDNRPCFLPSTTLTEPVSI